MAKYALTDHEYRIALNLTDDTTPWVGCTLTNSRVEANGTYTIIDIPDQNIPIGCFQVRVKAIGNRHASAILSNDVAFVGTSFSFSNGIFPDGVNDYLEVQSITTLPSVFTVSFWVKTNTSTMKNSNGMFFLNTSGNEGLLCAIDKNNSTSNTMYLISSSGGINGTAYVVNNGLNNYSFIFNSTTSKVDIYLNGVKIFDDISVLVPTILTNIQICRFNLSGNYTYNQMPMDEFTIYNRALTITEIQANYNNGNGANPASPANLLVHYKFEVFENFTFPGGSALGIKDFSGNNNHAKQYNMDTNPASPNYVIKPFL